MAHAAPIGPLVRLWGISASQLPAPTASADELAPLLIAILQEALPFIDSAAPRSGAPADPKLWKRKATKTSPASSSAAAAVDVSARVVSAAELAGVVASAKAPAAAASKPKPVNETWACRRSVHEDRAARGTASWAEFERFFRDEHAAAEVAFTPNAVAGNEAIVWPPLAADGGRGVPEVEEGGGVWGRFALKLVEMRHKVGRPVLRDRTFPVLQMTAAAAGPAAGQGGAEGGGSKEFVVVSIPVPDFGSSESSKLARQQGAQLARYVSVERIRKLDDGRIEWLMATASDAGGVLPMWVQNMAIPAMIWKDVPLFLGWIAKEREGPEGKDGAKSGPPGKATNITEAAKPATETAEVPTGS